MAVTNTTKTLKLSQHLRNFNIQVSDSELFHFWLKKSLAEISADGGVQQRSKCTTISSLTRNRFILLFLCLEGERGPGYIKRLHHSFTKAQLPLHRVSSLSADLALPETHQHLSELRSSLAAWFNNAQEQVLCI